MKEMKCLFYNIVVIVILHMSQGAFSLTSDMYSKFRIIISSIKKQNNVTGKFPTKKFYENKKNIFSGNNRSVKLLFSKNTNIVLVRALIIKEKL